MPKNSISKPIGRPTKYSDAILASTRAYIDSCNDIPEDREAGIRYQVNLPTIEGLSYEIKISKDTILEWRKEHEAFSVLIGELLAKQARALVNYGLSGSYNPTIAKVLLTKHGYREGIDQTTDDKPINEVTPALLAKSKAFDEWFNGQH